MVGPRIGKRSTPDPFSQVRGRSFRVSNGTRTRDILDHNQVLYQLSYTHRVRSFPTGREKVYRVREGARATVVRPSPGTPERPMTSDFATGRGVSAKPRRTARPVRCARAGRYGGAPWAPAYGAGGATRFAMALECSESGPGCGTKTASR